MKTKMNEDRRYTDPITETETRRFICCTCEEQSMHENIKGRELKCECQKGTLLLMPLTMPYPTYIPGTRLTEYQKQVRGILRRWKNGWMHERREMLKECEIIPRWDYDATDKSQMESKRLCSSKDMPIKVYSWYHKHSLTQFIAGFPPEANTDMEQYAAETKLIEGGGVMQW